MLLRAIDGHGLAQGAYVRAFAEHFEVGGTCVGYADGPRCETIYNMTRLVKEIEQRVLKPRTSLGNEQRKSATHCISRYFLEFDRDGLKETVRTPLKRQQWKAGQLDEVDRIIYLVNDEAGNGWTKRWHTTPSITAAPPSALGPRATCTWRCPW